MSKEEWMVGEDGEGEERKIGREKRVSASRREKRAGGR